MDAKRFHGAADGPDLVIDRANDGTLLPKCQGWTCGRCEVLWATEAEAEKCCPEPGDAGRSLPANGPWPRLYRPG